MNWQVQVIGEAADLDMLSASISGAGVSIVKRDKEYVLEAEAFAELESAQAVTQEAEKILTALSGSARLVLGSHTSLSAGAVYRVKEDGSRDIFVSLKPATMRIRAMPLTATVTRANSTKEVRHPADPIAKWLPLATTDEAVAKVLRLRNSDELGWVDLYRVYEVIEDNIGSSTIVANGWATKRSIERFTRTANSVTAAGDKARHGRERSQPPRNPVRLSEARELVDQILKGWLEYKSQTSSN